MPTAKKMKLGIFLSSGDSIKNMAISGQDIRFKQFYLNKFAENFDKVYVFSYENEQIKDLPKNVFIVPNKYNLHRYIYSIIMPFLTKDFLRKSDVIRVFHLSGCVPAIIAKIFFGSKFVFNWAFDYIEFAKIEKKYLQIGMLWLLQPFAIFFSSHIFAANKRIYADFRKNSMTRDKVSYLPNGIDIEIFKPNNRKSKNEKIVLSVGRLETQKNYLNLIKAMKGLKAKLMIVGNGSMYDQLLAQAKSNKVNLEIISRIANTELPKIYNQATIFALPSLIEGHPKVLLEAMACGLPSVGARVEGVSDLIVDNKNGLFCQTNPSSISAKLKKLLSSSALRKKMGENARNYIKENYDLDKLFKNEIWSLKSVGEK